MMEAAQKARGLLASAKSYREAASAARPEDPPHWAINALTVAEHKEAEAKALRPEISRLAVVLAVLERELSDDQGQ